MTSKWQWATQLYKTKPVSVSKQTLLQYGTLDLKCYITFTDIRRVV